MENFSSDLFLRNDSTSSSSVSPAVIKVIGVGGGGGNAVNRMIKAGLTGVDFLKIIVERKLLNRTKVIMLTTIDDLQILKECFELGAVDYIHKPFNFQWLWV